MLKKKKLIINNKKILIITGKKSYNQSSINDFLKFTNCNVNFYFKKNNVPELKELLQLINYKKKINPEIIIGIGGGSVMDLSKMTSAINNIPKDIKNLKKIRYKKNIKLILIPTTAGSGSEATNFAVLYNSNKKYSLLSNEMRPNKVYIYPKVLKNLNIENKLSSALDILCQAVESIFAKKSCKLSLTYSGKALEIFEKFMPEYLANKTSTYDKMLIASNYAGKAINITKTNIPHALSYYLTRRFKVDHGYSVFLNFFGFLKFLYKKRYGDNFLNKRFKFLFRKFKIKHNESNPLNKLFENIANIIGKTIDYKKFSITKKNEVSKIIKAVNVERLKNSPLKISNKDLKEIILYDYLKI